MNSGMGPRSIDPSEIPERLQPLVARARFLGQFFLYMLASSDVRPRVRGVLGESGEVPTDLVFVYNKWTDAIAVLFLWISGETELEYEGWYDSDTWVFPEKGAGFYAIAKGQYIKLAGVNMLGTCQKGIGPIQVDCHDYMDIFADSTQVEISGLLADIFGGTLLYQWEHAYLATLHWKPL